MELINLPKDVLLELLIRVNIPDLANMCCISPNINRIWNNNYFWEQRLVYDNLLVYEIKRDPNESAKQYYQRIYLMSDGEKLSIRYSNKFKNMVENLKGANYVFRYQELKSSGRDILLAMINEGCPTKKVVQENNYIKIF